MHVPSLRAPKLQAAQVNTMRRPEQEGACKRQRLASTAEKTGASLQPKTTTPMPTAAMMTIATAAMMTMADAHE